MKVFLVESGDVETSRVHAVYSDWEEAMKHLTQIATEEYETDFKATEFNNWVLLKTENGYRIKRNKEAGFALQWYDVEEMEVRDKYNS